MTKKQCQYKSPYCQKEAEYQHIIKLGKVKVYKGHICDICKEYSKKIKKGEKQ
ncbi:hypothetical protein [endosymbiont GvMRE of Glomus versiforme]|uniref:hypothetical protein n=1 Tax=endosymbiont GvMRE of Glomus versiforme TaxID=2039283 RepID=UPI000ED65DCF|nr:hypothetical protein [endosymbiont GvMRE of Glomus versiforme]RHZ36867.1 hypothetical protein GvMRE_I2g51 [endosymbiont GvMRE of Glomus versiforme]